MRRIDLFVEKRGIRKNSPKSVDNVQDATLRLYPDGMWTAICHEISIDARHRDGTPREEELVFIKFADGEQWSGTFNELQHALKVAKGMKQWEESTPIKQDAYDVIAEAGGDSVLWHLSDERRQDMLVGALEGGSNYWYEFRKKACKMIEHVSSDANTFVDNLWRALESGYDIPVHDVENGDLIGSISMTRIIEGENLMREQHPEHWANIINENDDAETADVWFQMVVLKELVYG